MSRTALAAGLLTVALPFAAAPADDPEEQAAAWLEKAERHVEKGQHKRAVDVYEKIVKKYPETAAGEVAGRRSLPSAYLGKADILRSGPSSNRVDVVILGDGYTLKLMDGYDDIVGDIPRVFERNRVFGEYLSYLNLVRGTTVSEEKGIDSYGKEYRTVLGGKMSRSIQGQVTVDREAVRRILREELPEADGFAVALVRLGTLGTGGGGVAAVAAREFNTLIHEWGHAFANLQDEYSSHTGYRGEAVSSINVSSVEDPQRVPWAHFIEARVRGVGVYEGADGRVRGAWKPTSAGCIMGNGGFFCPVCREALVLRLYEFVDPIDAAVPPPSDEPLRLAQDGAPLTFSVQAMRPKSHTLEVSWWLFPEAEAPPHVSYDAEAASVGKRRSRGPLPPIEAKPAQRPRGAKNGVHRFELKPRGLAPGGYVVIVRAVDSTKLRGEKHPWVLKDEAHLLRSERRWKVIVE
ncbi:MAG: M64 family metallopeptidase [Planctomycetota bacterium]